MPRDEPLQCACPPIALSDVVGKKWATRVVTLLGSHGPLGFGRLHAALPRVSPTTLVSTLRELEHGHLVVRVPVPGDGRSRGEYRLTPDEEALYPSLLPFARCLRGALERTADCAPGFPPHTARTRPE